MRSAAALALIAMRVVAPLSLLLAATALGGCCTPGPLAAFFGCSDLRATATAKPETAQVGESFSLRGRAVTPTGADYPAADVKEVTYAWDYTDDGTPDFKKTYSVDSSGLPELSALVDFTRPGIFTPAFTVVTDDLKRATVRTAVTVTPRGPEGGGENQPPVASFTGPDTAMVGQEVTFDSSASYDPDARPGELIRREWDFTDDGSLDRGSGAEPRITTVYDAPGDYTVRLVLTDARGARGTTTRTIHIREGEGTGPSGPTDSGARAAAVARPFTAMLRGRAIGRTPRLRTRGRVRTRPGVLGSGRIKARLTPPRRAGDGALRGLLDSRWLTRVKISFNRRTLVGRLDGIALARPARHARGKERACLIFSVKVPAFGAPRGSIRQVGGTGRFARLRAKAGFTTSVSGTAFRLSGTTTIRHRPRRGLSKCRSLSR
jgi:hypothetical protein